MRIRRWLRQIEPRILAELDRPSLAWAKPWLDRHELFAFTRRPLARGLAIGLLCGLIPGRCRWPQPSCCVRCCGQCGDGVATTFYTNPFTIVPLYALAFQIGSALLPGEQVMPVFNHAAAGASGWLPALSEWVSALRWPGGDWSAGDGILVRTERLPAVYVVVAASGGGTHAADSQSFTSPRLKCGQRLTLQCK